MDSPSCVSISEAARRAGVSRVTIHRAIDKGVISKEIGGDGKPVIRLSELARVYPRADVSAFGGKIHSQQVETVTERPSEQHNDTGGLQAQIELLQATLSDAREQRDKAQAALEVERQERLKQAERIDALLEVQTRLLTDQRPRKSWFSRG